ncbi:MAG: 50S ribosomal protein L31 [Candidatus Portnoybacteria bacterium]|nr:50S ribosomal protein L31 [Candidatus Portnoybacteria bacterium]
MKDKIHPKYHKQAVVHCSCGNTFKVGATKPEIKVEVCSACHPFYTGKEKILDTAGRVDKFKKRVERAQAMKSAGSKKKKKKKS